MTNSPLGQYAPAVAALVCAGAIAVYLVALVFGAALRIDPAALSQLHDLAILAFGAVVGSAVAVNGWRQPLSATHQRLDNLESSFAVVAHAAGLPAIAASSHDGGTGPLTPTNGGGSA